MDSRVYKILGAITIGLGVVIGLMFATVTVPAIDGFSKETTAFVWSTFFLYAFIGFIGGMILIGIGNIAEDLASLEMTQQQHTKRLENTIAKGNDISNVPTPVRHSSTTASRVSSDTPKSRFCLTCGKPLPSNTDTMMCKECLEK